MKLTTERHRVLVGNSWWIFATPIVEARMLDDRVVVLFDYTAYPRLGSTPNLRCYDLHQKELWIAEHPINDSSASYVSITEEQPLIAWNFACFVCTIDLRTGRLLSAQFTK